VVYSVSEDPSDPPSRNSKTINPVEQPNDHSSRLTFTAMDRVTVFGYQPANRDAVTRPLAGRRRAGLMIPPQLTINSKTYRSANLSGSLKGEYLWTIA
jgi:hypothetical protein